MDTVLLTKLLQEKGWQITQKCQGHYVLANALRPQAIRFITPTVGSELIPTGTLNAALRVMHGREKTGSLSSFVHQSKAVTVILEKQADGLWGRIDIPGLMAVTRGCTADCVVNSLRKLLTEFALDEGHSCAALASMAFSSVYDTTVVWNLIRQLKATHLAEQIGVDMDVVGQFMTGNTHPCSETATRLEESIRELGRQLMRVSIR